MSQMADGLMQNDFLCVVYCLPQGYFVGHRVSELVTVTWSIKKALLLYSMNQKAKLADSQDNSLIFRRRMKGMYKNGLWTSALV